MKSMLYLHSNLIPPPNNLSDNLQSIRQNVAYQTTCDLSENLRSIRQTTGFSQNFGQTQACLDQLNKSNKTGSPSYYQNDSNN